MSLYYNSNNLDNHYNEITINDQIDEIERKNSDLKLTTKEKQIQLGFELTYLAYQESLKKDFSNLNDKKLKIILSSPITINPSIQYHIRSFISSQIVNKTEVNNAINKIYTNRDGVNNVFSIRLLLEEDTTEGITFYSGKHYNTYVIKIPKPGYDDDIAYEAIIGIACLNNIRNYIPNFAYTYGYGTCYIPLDINGELLSDGNNLKNWCDNGKDKGSFLVMENANPSVSLHEFLRIKDLSIIDLQKVYLQIFNALNVAYQLYQYTHQDLHSTNILIRSFNKDIKINIYGDNMKIIGELTTKYVPYIIDYGRNSALINKKEYQPNVNYLYKNPFGNWLYDINILLYHTCTRNKYNIREFANNIWNFIYEGTKKPISEYNDEHFLSANIIKFNLKEQSLEDKNFILKNKKSFIESKLKYLTINETYLKENNQYMKIGEEYNNLIDEYNILYNEFIQEKKEYKVLEQEYSDNYYNGYFYFMNIANMFKKSYTSIVNHIIKEYKIVIDYDNFGRYKKYSIKEFKEMLKPTTLVEWELYLRDLEKINHGSLENIIKEIQINIFKETSDEFENAIITNLTINNDIQKTLDAVKYLSNYIEIPDGFVSKLNKLLENKSLMIITNII